MPSNNAKKRIVYLVTRTELGGAQSHLYELLRHSQDYDVTLISGEDSWLAEKARELSIPVIIEPTLSNTLNIATNIRCILALRKTLKVVQPNILHIHSSKAGVLGRIAACKLPCKKVFTAHGWAFGKDKPRLRHYLALISETICAPLSDWIITVSQFDLQLAKDNRIANKTQCSYIHNGIDDIAENQAIIAESSAESTLAKVIKENQDYVNIVMVARLAKPKVVSALVEALAIINQNNNTQKVRCYIIGDGPDKEALITQSKALGLIALDTNKKQNNATNIEFIGAIDHVAEILPLIDIFVLVSRWEGLPISIIEAMRACLPIIASNVGGVSEQVINNHNGYLLENNSPELIAEKLQLLIMNAEMRKTFGLASKKAHVDKFHVNLMIKKTHAIYHNLIYNEGLDENSDLV